MSESVNCLRCGRKLTSATSIARRYGKGCAARIRHTREDVAGFKPEQVAAARELIEDGAIVAIRNRVFRAVSSDGTRLYLTAPEACNCAAGLKAKHMCFHRIAARLLLAA
ncbi:DUF6011 domain-containing protein [Streptomyces sp. NPDC006784]|uniref:DUF6011 domain-containing protein n=1 Tax=Streptomyces sp. NPDC006784 TaxID=3364764 RepID=UPI003690DFE6